MIRKNGIAWAFVAALFVGGCARTGMRGAVVDAIRTHCRDASPCIIDMKDVATFDWERMYVFGPGTDREAIRSIIGVDIADFDTLTERILFTRGHALVRSEAKLPDYESKDATNVVFAPTDASGKYFSIGRDRSELRVGIEKSGQRMFYTLQPAN